MIMTIYEVSSNQVLKLSGVKIIIKVIIIAIIVINIAIIITE